MHRSTSVPGGNAAIDVAQHGLPVTSISRQSSVSESGSVLSMEVPHHFPTPHCQNSAYASAGGSNDVFPFPTGPSTTSRGGYNHQNNYHGRNGYQGRHSWHHNQHQGGGAGRGSNTYGRRNEWHRQWFDGATAKWMIKKLAFLAQTETVIIQEVLIDIYIFAQFISFIWISFSM